MSTPRDVYWFAQGGLLALLLLQAMVSVVPWQFALGGAAIAQCYLVPTRLNDAGGKPWLPFVILALLAGAIWASGVWAAEEVGGDGRGLLWGMTSIVVSAFTGAVLIIWPGFLPTRARASD